MPVLSRLLTEYFTNDGVTVPNRNSGKTNRTIQVTKAAQIRKLVSMAMTSRPVTSRMMYLPKTGIAAIQTADIIIRLYRLAGSGFRSAILPPQMLPRAMAIMIVAIIIVQTIWDELKYGAISRLAASSTAMTPIPEKNSVR